MRAPGWRLRIRELTQGSVLFWKYETSLMKWGERMQEKLGSVEAAWRPSPIRAVRQERSYLADPDWVAASHDRCRKAGLDPALRSPRMRLMGEQIYALLSHHQTLIGYAQLLFNDVHRELVDDTATLLLTDGEGFVLTVHSSPETLDLLENRYSLAPGISMAELSCGTTATSMALHHRQPVAVRGEQYYCEVLRDWFSAAAPVIGADGRPYACVTLCASSNSPVGEKLPLARFIARDLTTFGLSMHRTAPTHPPAGGISEPQETTPSVALTERQRQVLTMFAKGMSYKEIARAVGINSVKTVEQHLDAVRNKLGAGSRRECIQRALEIGLLNQ